MFVIFFYQKQMEKENRITSVLLYSGASPKEPHPNPEPKVE